MINKVFNIRELAPKTDDRGKMFQLDVKSIRFDAENKLLIQQWRDCRKERAVKRKEFPTLLSAIRQ